MTSPAAAEQTLIESYSIIPDPHERMSAIVAACAGPGLGEGERREEDLVPGCVSRVWLTGASEKGALKLRWDADSPLVKGLTGLVCGVYHGASPAEAAAHRTNIIAGLKFDRQLSPTRLNGLENVGRRIQEIAAGL
ncbi:MAG TPA: SufE family protein [Verrucomicrobiales bacterium]|jgi:cysteine desulfuration protein SufE|nr:SufE family protein [Verrucomicrobiales bacterium]